MMHLYTPGFLVAALVCGLLGGSLSFAPRFAQWTLSVGRAQIWNKLLGPDRALKLTRYFFGPVLMFLAAVCALAAFAPPPPAH